MEQVWGIPRTTLFEQVPEFQGFLPQTRSISTLGAEWEDLGTYRPRDEVEEDPTWKQIIPYAMVMHDEKILTLIRLSTQGEARLHGKMSIGIGGHINPEKDGPGYRLEKGLRRELEEELHYDDSVCAEPQLLGFINDDSNAVGSVHFGVAIQIQVSRPLEIRETDRMEGQWWSRAVLQKQTDRLESWSQLILAAT